MDRATCAMWLRNFPSSIDVTGSWQIETHLFMGSPLQPNAINSMGVIGIFDSTQNGGAGLLSHYGGIRSDGYPYNPGWESIDHNLGAWGCTSLQCYQNQVFIKITRLCRA